MPTCSIDQAEAVRRYYAAFPALKKGEESPLKYYLPPPLWCRKADSKMQSESIPKDWNVKKKFSTGTTKDRRNSYHGQKKNKKRCNSYSRSFESKENLPEWMTHEGIWDMEAQDPVREFIRALALDEGYGTCENTLAEDARDAARPVVPEWDDSLDLDGDWVLGDDATPRERTPAEEELYAKFEAKFDRSIEALWERDTPDDLYQELPVDFGASPALHDRLRPLHLDEPPLSLALYDVTLAAGAGRSFAAINHSRDASSFVEVPPRRRPALPEAQPPPPPPAARAPECDSEDLLTSARTHFRPIERSAEVAPRYRDGDTFDISGDLEPVKFRRSDSGGAYLASGLRYLEYRAEERDRGIDYGRLALSSTQRSAGDALPLLFPVRQLDAAAQTDGWAACDECASSAKKMRPDDGVWSAPRACRACAAPPVEVGTGGGGVAGDELARDWEELLADIAAAHASLAAGAGAVPTLAPDDRKRRHSAALRCARHCAHPHARFLPCCALDRPLTR